MPSKLKTAAIIGGNTLAATCIGFVTALLEETSITCEGTEQPYYSDNCSTCDDVQPKIAWTTRILFSIFIPCCTLALIRAAHTSSDSSTQALSDDAKKDVKMNIASIPLFYTLLVTGFCLTDAFMLPKTHDCDELTGSRLPPNLLVFSLAMLMSQSIGKLSLSLFDCLKEKTTHRKHERLLDEALSMQNYGTQEEASPIPK